MYQPFHRWIYNTYLLLHCNSKQPQCKLAYSNHSSHDHLTLLLGEQGNIDECMDLMQKVELMLKERDTILQRFTDQKRVLRERAGVDVSNGFSNQTKPTQPNPTLTYPDLNLI